MPAHFYFDSMRKDFLPDNTSVTVKPLAADKTGVAEHEKLIETVLEAVLAEHSERINEGSNGIIFKIAFEQIPDVIVAYIKQTYGIEVNTDQVIKTLKIYLPGTGRYEFNTQRQAWRIVQQAIEQQTKTGTAVSPEATYAKVPTPMMDRDVSLSAQTVEWLRQQGMSIVQDRMEVLMMDYVPGYDLMTVLYRELIRRHPRFRDEAYRVDLPDGDPDAFRTFEQLQQVIKDRLTFFEPGGKSRDEGARAYEQRKVESANVAMIIKELNNCGFKLHQNILTQINNTIKLFHSQNLFLRDFHLRNAMVVGDPSADAATPPQSFIIDFGRAIIDQSLTADEMNRPGEDVHYIRDDAIVRQLWPLTPQVKK